MKLDFVVYQRHQDGLGIIGGELAADEFMTGLWGVARHDSLSRWSRH
jgi:hypothetical protein